MPAEVRACIFEVNFDRKGNINFKLHDKPKAISELIRTVAPDEGRDVRPRGCPMQLEAMIDPKNISKLSDDEAFCAEADSCEACRRRSGCRREAAAVENGGDDT